MDGNKRTGVASALLFLRFNGEAENVSESELFDLALRIACNDSTKADVIAAFQRFLRRRLSVRPTRKK